MIKNITLLVTTLFVVGCGPSQFEVVVDRVSLDYKFSEKQIKNLGQNIDNGYLSNIAILKQYAAVARVKKPEYTKIIDTLESEGSSKGPTYQSLVKRLSAVKESINKGIKDKNEVALNVLSSEITSLKNAGSTKDFNVMLVDAINVLSGFTDGELPKLRELQFIDESESSAVNGSEYVGNPNYGSWKSDSSGNSFWAWYGQYAFFSSMFNGPVYYGSWSTNRPPSYYHDYGRDRYSSPSQRNNQREAQKKTAKTFSSKGQSFKSPYAKSAATKTAVQNAKKTGRVAKAGGFKSQYAKSSSYSRKSSSKSNYNSRSSSIGSRSSFGGK